MDKHLNRPMDPLLPFPFPPPLILFLLQGAGGMGENWNPYEATRGGARIYDDPSDHESISIG